MTRSRILANHVSALGTRFSRSATSRSSAKLFFQRLVSLLFLAVISSPLILLYAAWRSQTFREKHWLFSLFVGFFGATITITYDPFGSGSDGVRHLNKVIIYYMDMSFNQFVDDLVRIVTLQDTPSGTSDLFFHFAAFVSGAILGEPMVFFIIVGLVFGYFMSGALLIVFRDWDKLKKPALVIFFALLIFFIFNVQGVQVVRTTTGLWVLVYGVLRYFSDGRLSSILIIGSSPIFHFGYLLIALPTIIVILLKNKANVYFMLFLLSNITNLISPIAVLNELPDTPVVEHRVKGYYREDQIDFNERVEDLKSSNQRFWNVYVRSDVIKWILFSFVMLIMASGIYYRAFNLYQQSLFCVALATLTFSNMTWFLTELSARSWKVGIVLVLSVFLMARLSPLTSARFPTNLLYRVSIYFIALGFVPYLLWSISNAMDYFSIYLIGLPWVPMVDPSLNMSLKDLGQIILFAIL